MESDQQPAFIYTSADIVTLGFSSDTADEDELLIAKDREREDEDTEGSALLKTARASHSRIGRQCPLVMGIGLENKGCFGSGSSDENVAHEGLLRYESREGKWKERWFLLDASDCALIKCATSSRQRSRSYGSILGHDMVIAGVQPLPRIPVKPDTSPQNGMVVITKRGRKLSFLTKSADEEAAWVTAISKLSHGFTRAISKRLADRELLGDKYALVRELGRGAAGVVSLYTYQGKPYAIKKIAPPKGKSPPNRLAKSPGPERKPAASDPGSPPAIPEEVRREIAILKKASSLPYVIALHDVILDPEQGSYYLVMEYMGGGAIAEWDGDRKCYVQCKQTKSFNLASEKTVRVYMTNLVLGIQALHANRLCHRDIKPENIMANEQHTMCKIGDLGVARYFREHDGVLEDETNVEFIELSETEPSSVPLDAASPCKPAMIKSTKGTYQFLPPEALSGDEYCGFKADIWSIGVTMYALLFGYLPYFSTDVMKLFEKIEKDPLVFPASCVDEDLKDLLRSILEKDPEKRITLDGILAHKWLHRNVNSKALTAQVRTLKRAPVISIAESEVNGAVSVLQDRFDALRRVVRRSRFDESMLASAATAADGITLDDEEVYEPHPVATDEFVIPDWIMGDTQLMAAQLHYEWCRSKHVAGWQFNEQRDDSQQLHPYLVPMRDLPEEAQATNVRCVLETLKCVIALGCQIHRASSPRRSSLCCVPFNTEQITLSWDMFMLVDLLAENAHEVWSAEYIKNGWTFGEHFDAAAKTHPSLRPYMLLDEGDKTLSREGVTSVLKTSLCLGYVISCARKPGSPRGSSPH